MLDIIFVFMVEDLKNSFIKNILVAVQNKFLKCLIKTPFKFKVENER